MDLHAHEFNDAIEDAGYGPSNGRSPNSDNPGAHQSRSPVTERMTLQLREEELVAEKQLVQIGVVRIRRQVIRETRTVEVVVAREEMIVERLTIEPGAAPEKPTFDQVDLALADRLRRLQLGETLRLPIVEEEVIIEKRPIVRQELVIDKRLVEEVRKLSDTVRWEDARITRLGSVDLAATDEAQELRNTDDKANCDSTSSARAREAVRASFLDAERTVELREEELRVRTQIVEAGAVEVRSGVVSEQRSVVVRAEHEETAVEQISVERRPAERSVGGGQDIFDIPQYGEQVILQKRPVVIEEISLDKEVVQDVQRVRTTVRREEAKIEIEADIRLHGGEESLAEYG